MDIKILVPLIVLALHCHNKAADFVTDICEKLAGNGSNDDNGPGNGRVREVIPKKSCLLLDIVQKWPLLKKKSAKLFMPKNAFCINSKKLF